MRYQPPKFSRIGEMAYIDVCRLNEDEARKILENIRWPKKVFCPHCESKKIVKIQAQSAMSLESFEEAWWSGVERDFWGHTIPNETENSHHVLHMFYSSSPKPRTAESIWENVKKYERRFKIIELSEAEIWKHQEENEEKIDLSLYFINEKGEVCRSDKIAADPEP